MVSRDKVVESYLIILFYKIVSVAQALWLFTCKQNKFKKK